ncbi:PaaX family transcriptional regulator [Paramicrobacterium fandaimingii]|uniref:PaaX family transcriptional regulator n=1 Tax=Paramicrobacterium fandaimingii TaxID=2708079 RepID=UPI00141E6D02|nr:PaaX family transcriptional regulator C-terminal domain-containing protein [Microbacterium fandaimingii]
MTTATPLLPRFQQDPRSQQLLTVLLGDYWFARDEPIPSSALVELLSVFDVTPRGGRAAIQRLAQRGFLQSEKSGRRTAYAVTPKSRRQLDAHVRSLFPPRTPEPWDGTWTLVAYSLPDDARETRRALRERLRIHGFGNLYDALWMRPGEQTTALREISDELGAIDPDQVTVFTGAQIPRSMSARAVWSAFDLDDVAGAYRAFIARWGALADRIPDSPAELLSGEEALRTRTSIMTDWRALRRADPHLPAELLGVDFPMHEAREVCAKVYDHLGPPAESVFRRILTPHDGELAQRVSHHTFAASDSLLGDA